VAAGYTAILPITANEILFLVGCSLVLFSAGVVGEKMAREDPERIRGW
jgi:hypothetical protein